MSAVWWCGRYWRIGEDDLVFPGMCSLLFFALPTFALGVATVVVSHRVNQPIAGCVQGEADVLLAFPVYGLVLGVFLMMVDGVMSRASMHTYLFKRNPKFRWILNFRMFGLVAGFVFCILAVISLIAAYPCYRVTRYNTFVLYWRLILALSCMGYIHTLASMVFILCACQSRDSNMAKRWERRLRYLCCLWCFVEKDQDALAGVGEIFANLFDDERVVPSDMAVSLALVRAMQKGRKDKDGQPLPVTFPAESEATAGRDPAAEAVKGIQPHLTPADITRLKEAKYYSKYAIGVYGWAQYMLSDFWCGLSCVACSPGGMCCPRHRFRSYENIQGSGCSCWCCPGFCTHSSVCGFAHWDLNIFLRYTGISSEDVLHAFMSPSVNKPVVIICLDRTTKAVVVAIRGTMSISDAVTDLAAMAVEIPARYGPPLAGHKAHMGMVMGADSLVHGLVTSGVLKAAIKDNPEYDIIVTGHSLGAGMACLVTMFILNHPDLKSAFEKSHGKVRAICYAPPPVLEPALADSDAMRDLVTTIVYNNDIISRLNLNTMYKLKVAMKRVREDPPDGYTKYQVLKQALLSSSIVNSTEHGPLGGALLQEIPQEMTEDANVLAPQTLSRYESFHQVNHLPGRIFHMLPAADTEVVQAAPSCAKRCCRVMSCLCTPDIPARCVIYPASQKTFQEILVSSTMGKDHMPYNYSLKEINIPDSVQEEP